MSTPDQNAGKARGDRMTPVASVRPWRCRSAYRTGAVERTPRGAVKLCSGVSLRRTSTASLAGLGQQADHDTKYRRGQRQQKNVWVLFIQRCQRWRASAAPRSFTLQARPAHGELAGSLSKHFIENLPEEYSLPRPHRKLNLSRRHNSRSRQRGHVVWPFRSGRDQVPPGLANRSSASAPGAAESLCLC